MACVNPDGTLSGVAEKILSLVEGGAEVKALAEAAGVPVYRVRASLRELVQAGLLVEAEGGWASTEAGRAAVTRSG